MDLLAKRYASPFTVIDEMIRQRRVYEFVCEINEIVSEESLWDIWLHKVFDKGWEEWLAKIQAQNEDTPSAAELGATVKSSKDLLNSFDPTIRG